MILTWKIHMLSQERATSVSAGADELFISPETIRDLCIDLIDRNDKPVADNIIESAKGIDNKLNDEAMLEMTFSGRARESTKHPQSSKYNYVLGMYFSKDDYFGQADNVAADGWLNVASMNSENGKHSEENLAVNMTYNTKPQVGLPCNLFPNYQSTERCSGRRLSD